MLSLSSPIASLCTKRRGYIFIYRLLLGDFAIAREELSLRIFPECGSPALLVKSSAIPRSRKIRLAPRAEKGLKVLC